VGLLGVSGLTLGLILSEFSFWMAANMEKHLSLDYTYLGSLPRPTAPWGTQPPHEYATRTETLQLTHTPAARPQAFLSSQARRSVFYLRKLMM
jgi:hypothetical protein